MTDNPVQHSAAEIEAQLRRIPYAQFLGFALIGDGNDIIGRMAFAEHLIGNPIARAIHGGSLAALLEFTATCKLLSLTSGLQLPRIINISVEYIRSGRPLDTYARATVTKHGRRVANVNVVAYQDDISRPIAMANSHFLLAD
jgi:acyl-coenzyme A thioesterase PaaI-like protein